MLGYAANRQSYYVQIELVQRLLQSQQPREPKRPPDDEQEQEQELGPENIGKSDVFNEWWRFPAPAALAAPWDH